MSLVDCRCSIQRLFHHCNMLRSCPTAPTDDRCPCLAKRKCVLAKVFRLRGIHNAPTDLFGPACIWLYPKPRVRRCWSHLFEQTQKLSRTARTIDPDHIYACFLEHPRHLYWIVTEQSSIIARECDRGDNRQITNLPRGFDCFTDFIQIAERFDDDQVNARLSQRTDLLRKRLMRSLRLDSAIGRNPHSQGTYIPGNQYIPERCSNNTFSEIDASFVDFNELILKSMLCQFESVCSERIGNDQLCACFNIRAVNLCHCRRICKIQFVKAFVESHAAGMEHGPHCAIGEEGLRGYELKKFRFCH